MKEITAEGLEEAGLLTIKNSAAQKLLFKYLKINRINELLKYSLQQSGSTHAKIIDAVLNKVNIHVELPEAELKNIPKSGPFIVMANHPFGFLDGIIMIKILNELYPQFKVLANYFLKEIEPLADSFIELNPFENSSADNISGLKTAFKHLKNGNPLGIFPAGEVATMQRGFGKIEDKEWDEGVIKFLIKAKVPVIPMFFSGHNSLVFHLLGKIHPYLRTLSIPSEFFKKENKTIHVRIGKPISPEVFNDFSNVEKAGKYLRTCLYALNSKPDIKKKVNVAKRIPRKLEDIIPPVNKEVLESEIASIKEKSLLFEKSAYEIYLAKPEEIPNIIRELGRLRETTFRQVGEGTNQALDIDKYDKYYSQLFIWQKDQKQIIGAYRVGFGKEILKNYGKKGFYITSLFDLEDGMNDVLSQTIELGRSFVIKEFQQKPLPLFLLWQGILRIILKDEKIRYIMGPVSISNDFTRFSKDLLIAFIKKHHYNHELASMVHPKKEFKVRTDASSIEVILERNKGDMQKLDKFISGIEPGYLKIPVLLKQYIRQNAKIISFNVDPNFNDCLDGLMIGAVKDLPEETYNFLGDNKKN